MHIARIHFPLSRRAALSWSSVPGNLSTATRVAEIERAQTLEAAEIAGAWRGGEGRGDLVVQGDLDFRIPTAQGLSMHPLSQALQEFPEVRGPYEALHRQLGVDPARGPVQMLARVGYSTAPAAPAPRRDDQDGPDDGWNGPRPSFLSVGFGS